MKWSLSLLAICFGSVCVSFSYFRDVGVDAGCFLDGSSVFSSFACFFGSFFVLLISCVKYVFFAELSSFLRRFLIFL